MKLTQKEVMSRQTELINGNKLKSGNIVLYHYTKGFPWGFVAFGIRQFTESYWNHASVVVPGGVVEALPGGVEYNMFDETLTENNLVTILEADVPLDKRINLSRTALAEVGKKYDYPGVMGIAWNILTNKKRSKTGTDDKFWCSELVNDVYLKNKIDLFPNIDNTVAIYPADFINTEKLKVVYTDYGR